MEPHRCASKDVFERLYPDRLFDMPLKSWTRNDLADALAAAGCTNVTVHEVKTVFAMPSPEQLVEDALRLYRIAPPVQARSDAEFGRLRDPLIDAFRPFAGADGVRLPINAWVAIGTKR